MARRASPRLAAILAQLPVIVRVIATDGTYLLSEGQGLSLIGRVPGDLVGQSIFDVQRQRPDIVADLRRALAGEALHTVRELKGIVWETQYTPLHEDGALVGTLYVAMDVTARVRAEEELRASEARARALAAAAERQALELRLLDRVRTALARELDPAAVFRVVVEEIAATFGYTQVSLYSREGAEHVLQHQVGYDRMLVRIPITAGVSGRAVAEGRPILLRDVADDPVFLGAIEGITSEICVPLYDAGRPAGFLNVESTGVRLDEADLRLMTALGEHVNIAIERARLYDALREREARLLHQTLHDALTGLPNRRRLAEALDEALARLPHGGPPVALLCFDLDGFKAVNDALGHEAGDGLLATVADRLRMGVRDGDTPARLGGDEFAVLLAGADAATADAVAARLVAALAVPVRLGTATAAVTTSAGVALAIPGETGDDLLRRADAALYAAKRAGKNRRILASAWAPGA
jgi:diguanylate cyclase (GGDEF)-like protein